MNKFFRSKGYSLGCVIVAGIAALIDFRTEHYMWCALMVGLAILNYREYLKREKADNAVNSAVTSCPPHQWVLDPNRVGMICTKCNESPERKSK